MSAPTHVKLEHYILRSMNKAIREYNMISAGDRIAVAVSGGKDSLALLHLLLARQALVPDPYEVVAVHVVADAASCGDEQPVDSGPLQAHLAQLGIEYVLPRLEPPSGDGRRAKQGPCFHCAWRRRKAIFGAAEASACNKVAFGHHADDLAQTTLLNLFFHGRIETMEPRVSFFDGKLMLIRPLAYTREKEIARYARVAELPVVAQTCTGATSSQRALMAHLIAQVTKDHPKTKINLVRAALKPRDEEVQDEWNQD